jgi:serine/threonine protein kinase/Tol biopolymer transport system component
VSLIAGTRLGVYEVTAPIGSGGMGQVYRATDTRLKRQVAIKILPAAVAADRDRLSRFQREAEVLASLNHPHIAGIYGLEESGGVTALVMELVEGDDLSQRIARGAIPIDEALAIARQIAEALEAAHEQGIIHRDLKPANIKVRADGTVKVLDFGLAKAAATGGAGQAGAAGSLSMSPTITTPAMTEAGMILGTAAYMSPEQARGKAVDKRADIWAFGVVLLEMLTGERVFRGEDVSETLASILKDAPALDALPAGAPPRLRRLIERCLERDVKQRLRDIGEARVEIAKIQSGAPEPAIGSAHASPRRSTGTVVAWSIAGIAVAAAVAIGLLRPVSPSTDAARVVRLPFMPPGDVAGSDLAFTVVSPDGQKLVFSGRSSSDGRRMLWVRALDSLEAKPLPDTDEGIEPFWSPDSRSVAFGAQGKLKRVDLAGGRAQTLTDAGRLNGGAWSPSGVIVFSPDYNMPLYRVAAMGGERVPVTPPGTNARYPAFLPDGRHFLYYASATGGGAAVALSTYVGSIDSMEVRRLLSDAPAVYARPDRLLYNHNGMLVAQAFDAERLEFRGEPQAVAAGPAAANAALGGRFSVSDNGTLVVQDPPMFDYQLTWFDRAGKKVGTLGSVFRSAAPQLPRLSPDGRRLVVQRFDRRQELWIGDVARSTFDRFTTVFAQLAFWSPDGRSVICNTTFKGLQGIYQLPLGGGDEQLLLKGTIFPSSETADGKWLFYAQTGERTRTDLWALPLSGVAAPDGSRQPHPVVNSEFDEQQPQVSPDGRWLAYMSDVTGRFEVYVRPLTADARVGEATRVSISGGIQPGWGRNGRELFYINASRGTSVAEMMVVPVQADGKTFESGAAVSLFKVPMAPTQLIGRDYDVSPDGQRFLVGTLVAAPATPVTIVINWPASLKK